MRQFTSEERIRRVWDKEEAKAVLCRACLSRGGQSPSRKPEPALGG